MAQLIQMRQQIHAIETIKKITHAMRLISISSHSQMTNKIIFIQNYKKELLNIINILNAAKKPELSNNIINAHEKKIKKTLIILIGSQKGLTGTFNFSLFRIFEKQIHPEHSIDIDFITVGKKASDFLKKKIQPIKTYDTFTLQTLYKIAKEIFELIINSKYEYENIICFSNQPKSFFMQVPEKTIIFPIANKNGSTEINELEIESYIWEQPIQELYESVTKEYIYFNIQALLFDSLFAEQAARFNSMDSATKNAEDLLETLKRQYNKLRQAKITQEITEISNAK